MKAWIAWSFLAVLAVILLLAGLVLQTLAMDFAQYTEVSFFERYVGALWIVAVGSVLWLWAAYKTWHSSDWIWLGMLLFIMSWLVFPLFKLINNYLISWSADAWLYELDSLIWGGQALPAYFRYEQHPILADVLAACYFAFYFIVIAGVLFYAWQRQRLASRVFFNGLIAVYLLGFVGYFILPASGPAFYHLPDQGGGGVVTRFVVETVAQGVTGMDVFPSLHTAVTMFVVGFFYLDGYRKTAWLLLPVTIGLIMATIFLRYHYSVDVLCGVLLAWWALRQASIDMAKVEVQIPS